MRAAMVEVECMRAAMAAMMLVACSGGGDDGVGGGDGDGDGDGVCVEAADDCTGETICIAGRCEAAFERVYEIVDVTVSVPTTDPNGESWDAGGGAPDLSLDILVNDVVVESAPEVPDQFSASFPGPFNVTLISGSTLELVVFDVDISVDDLAYACQASPLTAALLRSRSLSCMSAGNSLAFEIDPR